MRGGGAGACLVLQSVAFPTPVAHSSRKAAWPAPALALPKASKYGRAHSVARQSTSLKEVFTWSTFGRDCAWPSKSLEVLTIFPAQMWLEPQLVTQGVRSNLTLYGGEGSRMGLHCTSHIEIRAVWKHVHSGRVTGL